MFIECELLKNKDKKEQKRIKNELDKNTERLKRGLK
jgi:hypothetical protein